MLKANGYGELVKVEESTRWADLKKLLSYTGDIATLTETGEIVEGVTVYETPGILHGRRVRRHRYGRKQENRGGRCCGPS